jgi:hypothetical protein
MPNSFGAQVYDISDPWAKVNDGNRRNKPFNTSENGGLDCCFGTDPSKGGNCPTPQNSTGKHYKPCPDKYNCSLPDPITGVYGEECAPWDPSSWVPSLAKLAPLIRKNAPSGVEGVNFMGGIHPRLKRPVGRRLAYAAARMMKKQQRLEDGTGADASADGAMSGPTIAGCTASATSLEIHFNASLLGGEGLSMRDENSISNASDWSPAPGWSGIKTLHDSSGLMVCFVNKSAPETGNETTCACSSWNFFKEPNPKEPNNPTAYWYCEVGPGWKPPLEVILHEKKHRLAEELRRRKRIEQGVHLTGRAHELGWVAQANKVPASQSILHHLRSHSFRCSLVSVAVAACSLPARQ